MKTKEPTIPTATQPSSPTTQTNHALDALAVRAAEALLRGTVDVLLDERYRPRDYDAVVVLLRQYAVEAIEEGLNDARQAVDAGMAPWAPMTFAASIAKAAARAGQEIIDRGM